MLVTPVIGIATYNAYKADPEASNEIANSCSEVVPGIAIGPQEIESWLGWEFLCFPGWTFFHATGFSTGIALPSRSAGSVKSVSYDSTCLFD